MFDSASWNIFVPAIDPLVNHISKPPGPNFIDYYLIDLLINSYVTAH